MYYGRFCFISRVSTILSHQCCEIEKEEEEEEEENATDVIFIFYFISYSSII